MKKLNFELKKVREKSELKNILKGLISKQFEYGKLSC